MESVLLPKQTQNFILLVLAAKVQWKTLQFTEFTTLKNLKISWLITKKSVMLDLLII